MVLFFLIMIMQSLGHEPVSNEMADTQHLDQRLLNAAFIGNADSVSYLLAQGANMDAKDVFGRTALMDAALMGHSLVVHVLLQAGANFELEDMFGSTALDIAALERRVDYASRMRVIMLLAAAARTEATDTYGQHTST